MNKTAVSPSLSLSALRGAVGGVMGAADEVGCWDRVVSIWRIFWALDRLMAVLWAIVDRLRAGEGCLAGAVGTERPLVAASGPVRLLVARPRLVRRRAVAAVRPVVTVGRGRRCLRAPVDWGPLSRGLAWRAPDLAVWGLRFSAVGSGLTRNCVHFVPVK